MLRFLTDEDFDGRLTSALLARVPGLDLVRTQDTGLMHTPDPDILAWAAGEGRIVLSHDRNTMYPRKRWSADAGPLCRGSACLVWTDSQRSGNDGWGQRTGRVARSDHLCANMKQPADRRSQC
jgi:hypothetical protein